MIALTFSILSTSLIFVLFRLFPKFGINTFEAIVFNYITAFGCGILLYGSDLQTGMFAWEWMRFAFLCGVLFIALFLIMGLSSQKNGIAETSVAVKMSMAVSVVLLLILHHEPLGFMQSIGILLALMGVFLVTWTSASKQTVYSSRWMLGLLFLGSGLLDVLLNYVQNYKLNGITSALFAAFSFGTAGFIGFCIFMYQHLSENRHFEWKNVAAGVVLGIPNYFSIYLLMLSYKQTGWMNTTVLTITNVSVVLTTSIIGFSIFKEAMSLRKIIGLLTVISAILVLYFSSN